MEWSTEDVPPRMRLDYWNGVLCEALFGFTIRSGTPNNFHGRLLSARLDALTVCDSSGHERVAIRDRHWIARAPEHVHSLLVDYEQPWLFVFRGERIAMARGDVIVTDTRFEQEAHNPEGCRLRNVRLPVAWLDTWVADTGLFVGRRIACQEGWGRVLSRCVAQWTPELLAALPLPGQVLSDQLGSLLSLVCAEWASSNLRLAGHERALADRLLDLMQQRRGELTLTATDVAHSGQIDLGTLHDLFVRLGTTFGHQLLQMRIAFARELLASPRFDALSMAEIGRRSGFGSTSLFTRAISRQLGQTPEQLRAAHRR